MFETAPPKPHRLFKWIWVPIVFTPGICFYVFGTYMLKHSKANALNLEMTIHGRSTELKNTAFLALWDQPIPEGKNAVWSIGAPLAWQRLLDGVVKEPIRIPRAAALAERLNNAPQTDEDLDGDACLAQAGRLEDGFAASLREKLEKRFPDLPPRPEDMPTAPEGLFAYALVQAELPFSRPFFQHPTGLHFTNGVGEGERVQAFGLGEKQRFAYREVRNQIEVLYDGDDGFVLDLNRYAMPHQCLLARIPRPASLETGWTALQEKLTAAQRDPEFDGTFLNSASLAIPQIFWDVTHDFDELSGHDRPLKNESVAGAHLEALRTRIRFKLDRGGAEPVSQTRIPVVKNQTHRGVYDFDRPFMLVLKDRRAHFPFLMVWFDNAELFDRR